MPFLPILDQIHKGWVLQIAKVPPHFLHFLWISDQKLFTWVNSFSLGPPKMAITATKITRVQTKLSQRHLCYWSWTKYDSSFNHNTLILGKLKDLCSPVSSTVQTAMGLIKKAIAATKITKVQTKVPQQGNPKMEQRVGKNPRKNSRGPWRWPHCQCHSSKAVHLHLIIKKSKIVPMVQAGKFLPIPATSATQFFKWSDEISHNPGL